MIEKAFAISAEPGVIWDALWADLSGGEQGAFRVEAVHWPSELALQVSLGGIPSRLTYRIEPRGDHCEVSARLEPLGFRYKLAQVLTFNHFKRNFELILVQGLSNLKTAVEGEQLVNADQGTD